MKLFTRTIFASLVIFLLLSSKANAVDYILGAYFMPKPTMPSHQFFDLKTYNRLPTIENERRKPLLGYYSGDNAEAMDWQIRWAKEGGLSYFIFDEYWTQSQQTPVYNTSLATFLASPLNTQMKFAVSLTISTVKNNDAQKASDVFVQKIAPYMKNTYFSKSNYLKMNEKPVVYIYNNASIFGNNTTPPWIASRLQAFEQQVGSDIYWIYATASSDETTFTHYKQMGYDALSPYYVAPGITVMTGLGDPNNGIPYALFIEKSVQSHTQYFQKAIAANLSFIPSATTNFDERPRYPNEPWHAKRSFTTNKTTTLYTSLIQQLKTQIDTYRSTNPTAVLTIDGKPLFGLGAWNEWAEDAQLEPGHTGLHPSDPYAVLKTIQTTFAVPSTNLYTSSPPDLTPPTPTHTSWNFGNPADVRYWYVNPTTTDIISHTNGQYGTFIVDEGHSTYLEGTVFLDATKYRGVRIPYSAVCGNQSSDCTQSITVTWFSTNCTGDTNSSCTDKTTPNKTGTVGMLLSSCTNKPNDSEWGYCDFIPDANDTAWSGTIEQLRITFFTKQQHPTYYSISTIQLLPSNDPLPSNTPLPQILPSSTITILSTNTPIPASKPGDANGDNKVNGQDYIVWLTHYRQQTTGSAQGDFNNNGEVDGADYIIWLVNYGR